MQAIDETVFVFLAFSLLAEVIYNQLVVFTETYLIHFKNIFLSLPLWVEAQEIRECAHYITCSTEALNVIQRPEMPHNQVPSLRIAMSFCVFNGVSAVI